MYSGFYPTGEVKKAKTAAYTGFYPTKNAGIGRIGQKAAIWLDKIQPRGQFPRKARSSLDEIQRGSSIGRTGGRLKAVSQRLLSYAFVLAPNQQRLHAYAFAFVLAANPQRLLAHVLVFAPQSAAPFAHAIIHVSRFLDPPAPPAPAYATVLQPCRHVLLPFRKLAPDF